MSSTLSVVYFLFALGVGNLPSLTGLAIYQDRDSCMAAITAMQPALPPDERAVKLVCLSSADLDALGKAAGG